jgi:ribonuclease J
MLQLLKPKVIIPQHGSHAQGVLTIELAASLGYVRDVSGFVLNDGAIFEFNPDGTWTNRVEMAPNRLIAVDGLGVGDVGEGVLDERRRMATDGVFVILMRLAADGSLKGAPDLLSRGFIFVQGAEPLMAATKREVIARSAVHKALAKTDRAAFRRILADEVGVFLARETARQPVVLPLLIDA